MDCSSAKGRYCKISKRERGRFGLISKHLSFREGSAMLLLSTTSLDTTEREKMNENWVTSGLRTVNLSYSRVTKATVIIFIT